MVSNLHRYSCPWAVLAAVDISDLVDHIFPPSDRHISSLGLQLFRRGAGPSDVALDAHNEAWAWQCRVEVLRQVVGHVLVEVAVPGDRQ